MCKIARMRYIHTLAYANSIAHLYLGCFLLHINIRGSRIIAQPMGQFKCSSSWKSPAFSALSFTRSMLYSKEARQCESVNADWVRQRMVFLFFFLAKWAILSCFNVFLPRRAIELYTYSLSKIHLSVAYARFLLRRRLQHTRTYICYCIAPHLQLENNNRPLNKQLDCNCRYSHCQTEPTLILIV